MENNDSCRGTQGTPLSLGKGEPPRWVGPGEVEIHPESSRKPHPAWAPAAARGPSSGPGTPPSGAGRGLNPATPALPLTPPGGGRPAHAQPATGGCAAPAPGSGHLSTEQGAWLGMKPALPNLYRPPRSRSCSGPGLTQGHVGSLSSGSPLTAPASGTLGTADLASASAVIMIAQPWPRPGGCSVAISAPWRPGGLWISASGRPYGKPPEQGDWKTVDFSGQTPYPCPNLVLPSFICP